MDMDSFNKICDVLRGKNIFLENYIDKLATYVVMNYKVGDIVVPKDVGFGTNIPVYVVYQMLEVLVDFGFFVSTLVFQCPECECVETSVTYDAYWSCPAWIVCPKCGCKADGLVETIVVYKVV